MKSFFRNAIRPIIQRCGIDVVRHREKDYPEDFTGEAVKMYESVQPFTVTSPERVNALVEAVKYIVASKIEGSFVECGVWKGGSVMAMALTLKSLGDTSRELYLYDTFSGMTEPTEDDISLRGEKAHARFSRSTPSSDPAFWAISPLEEVKANVFNTRYPKERFHFIEGKVEDTIPGNLPKEIALLRLDTDWYESTRHGLTHLFPLLKPNGVLILDDYGHWHGSKKAVDEYILANRVCILLNRIDYTGRIAVKSPSAGGSTAVGA